jgi:hypothetical protein
MWIAQADDLGEEWEQILHDGASLNFIRIDF